MRQEALLERPPNQEDKFDTVHEELLSEMKATALRLNADNGEVLSVRRSSLQGTFFYYELDSQTIGELMIVDDHSDIWTPDSGLPRKFMHQLIVETTFSYGAPTNNRLHYRIMSSLGDQYTYSLNPAQASQSLATDEAEQFLHMVDWFMDDLKQLERQ